MKKMILPLAFGLASLVGSNADTADMIGPNSGPTIKTASDGKPAAPPSNTVPVVPPPTCGLGPRPQMVQTGNATNAQGEVAPAPVSTPVDASEFKQTVVTAHLREAMAKDKNILWCNTFQLAWDEASQAFGGPLQPVNESAMISALNENLVSKGDLDEASYLAMAGSVKDGIIGRIQAELDKKFPDHDSFFSNSVRKLDPNEHNLFAFAYLSKNLQFNTPLYKADKAPIKFGNTKVASFGVWNEDKMQGFEERAKELSVIDYISDSDFILELKTKAADDRLFLARLKPGATMKDTIDTTLARVKKATPTEWQAGDVFKAPAIRLHIAKRYFDIHLKKFTAKASGQVLQFEDAVQDTRFVLDEKGAVLVSQAVLEAKLGDDSPIHKPRNFVCDGAFLVLLQRKDAKMPYFALWIANTELLTSLEPVKPAEPTDAKLPVAPPVLRPMPALAEPLPETRN